MPKYKVGDKIVGVFHTCKNTPGCAGINGEMEEIIKNHKVMTIREVRISSMDYYVVKENGWFWSECMVKPASSLNAINNIKTIRILLKVKK